MSTETYYDILGIAPHSDELQIRRAYLQLAKVLHPDKADKADDEKPGSSFERIQQAYAVLKDPHKRALYDRELGIKHKFGGHSLERDRFSQLLFSRSSSGGLGLRRAKSLNLRSRVGGFFQKLASIIKQTKELSSRPSTLQIYSVDSLPVSLGESVRIKSPLPSSQLSDFMKFLIDSLSKRDKAITASVVQLSFPESGRSNVFLVALKSQEAQALSKTTVIPIDAKDGVELSRLGEVFLLESGSDLFSEAIWKLGKEFSLPMLQDDNKVASVN